MLSIVCLYAIRPPTLLDQRVFVDALDNINSHLSDFESIEHDGGLEAQTPGADSKPSDVETPGGGVDGDEATKKEKRVRRMGMGTTTRSSPRCSITKLEADDDEDGKGEDDET